MFHQRIISMCQQSPTDCSANIFEYFLVEIDQSKRHNPFVNLATALYLDSVELIPTMKQQIFPCNRSPKTRKLECRIAVQTTDKVCSFIVLIVPWAWIKVFALITVLVEKLYASI